MNIGNHERAIFVALPVEERRPIKGGCCCDFCKSHPDRIPQWDTLGIDRDTLAQWTVHYPELNSDAPHKHDITIYWDDMPTYNRHKIALEIQDACNMRAIAREFVKVVDSAMAEHNNTGKVWSDSAVVLLVSKLESLALSNDRFSLAYDECQKRAQ